ELVRGKLVKLADSSEGIEFTVTKFSTFTLVSVDGLNAAQPANYPYIQGFGADFRPDAYVTRAQMAAMLARNLSVEAATAPATAAGFEDVVATHWAANEIKQAQAAGIMNGLGSSVFAPEDSITRAQMATIAYRWLQKQEADAAATTGTTSAATTASTSTTANAASFTDVPADLWAAEAIAYVQSAGLMTGYQDGSFKPDGKLTRAEAVKVLNVLFKRSPLTGAATPSFSDVPATHWAYADIEAAGKK
ncbi:S-layer homology domain-containing protein, partial [Paenibacillus silvae]|uniref:S-layer homology domain-containing protein n=1 Tax=Paenibacillus silvae TaxID=1325358 RepID=UPI001E32C4C4